MKLRPGNVWTIADGETWELDALRAYLTVDDEHPSFLEDTLEDSRFLTGLLPRVLDGFQGDDTQVLDERSYRWDPDMMGFRADILLPDAHPLRDYQLGTGRKMLHAGCGIAELATGAGKTYIASALIKHLKGQRREWFTVLVDRVFLVEQMIAELLATGAVRQGEVGALMSGRRDLNAKVLVGTAGSFYAGLKNSDMAIYRRLNATQVIIADECHHLPSASMARVMAACGARERFGLTATMSEEPGEHGWEELMMEGLTGPLLTQVPGWVLRQRGFLAPTKLILVPVQGRVSGFQWKKAYEQGMVHHKGRNSLILSVMKAMWDAGRKSLTFVTRKVHGRRLLRSANLMGVQAIFVAGGGKVMWVDHNGNPREEKWSLSKLADFVKRKPKAAVIATQVLDEGVDVPAFNVAIMAGGHKKMRRVLQRIGRCMRPSGGMTLIVDFVDRHHRFLNAHSRRRLKVYKDERFPALPHTDVSVLLGVPFAPSQALPYAEDWPEAKE